jgi:DNA-binding IclR family transcriptional regulator
MNRAATNGQPARIVPALARGLDVLELYLTDDRPRSAAAVATELALPRASVHGLVKTLAARGYLAATGRDGLSYQLGPRVFELGNAYSAGLDLVRLGTEVAEQLSRQCRETVHVAVLDGREALYVAKADSSHAVRMISALGRRVPAHLTAVGKVLLAGLSGREFEQLYPSGLRLERLTEHSITTRRRLRRELAAVRTDGIGWDRCESNADVACVAAPVHGRDGRILAAVSISVPTSRWNDGRAAELADLVREAASRLSRRLGGDGARQ